MNRHHHRRFVCVRQPFGLREHDLARYATLILRSAPMGSTQLGN